VRRPAAAEAVPGHDALKTFAFRGSHDIDITARLKNVGGDFLADFVLAGRGGKFPQDPEESFAGFLQMSLERLGDVLLLDAAVTHLNGVVAVLFPGLHLDDNRRLHLDRRHADCGAVFGKHLRHPQFFS